MKHMLLFSLMIASAASIMAKDVTGRVHSNGQGLPGVVVTDGTNFTITDKDGAYAMSAQDDADFIYIVTPSGYVASYADGTPAFYKPLGAKSLDFDLFEYSVPGAAMRSSPWATRSRAANMPTNGWKRRLSRS